MINGDQPQAKHNGQDESSSPQCLHLQIWWHFLAFLPKFFGSQRSEWNLMACAIEKLVLGRLLQSSPALSQVEAGRGI